MTRSGVRRTHNAVPLTALQRFRRHTFLTVDLGAIVANATSLKAEHDSLIAVLKCDAYGHGLAAVASKLEREEVIDGILIAVVDDAINLRRAGFKLPILLASGFFAHCYDDIIVHDLTPVVGNMTDLKSFAKHADRLGRTVALNIEVDVGMSRLGFNASEALKVADFASRHDSLHITGILAHPSSADAVDRAVVQRQHCMAQEFVKVLQNALRIHDSHRWKETQPRLLHFATSGVVASSKLHHLDCPTARVGLALYGVQSSLSWPHRQLYPALSWYSTVVALRTVEKGSSVGYDGSWTASRRTKVATVAIGYADGYPRALSSRGQMSIRGQRANVIGRICMDYTMIDATDIESVTEGTFATLLGSEANDPSVIELAQWAETTPYEILSRISTRIPRYYLDQRSY